MPSKGRKPVNMSIEAHERIMENKETSESISQYILRVLPPKPNELMQICTHKMEDIQRILIRNPYVKCEEEIIRAIVASFVASIGLIIMEESPQWEIMSSIMSYLERVIE